VDVRPERAPRRCREDGYDPPLETCPDRELDRIVGAVVWVDPSPAGVVVELDAEPPEPDVVVEESSPAFEPSMTLEPEDWS
jgi:hypothetical protein